MRPGGAVLYLGDIAGIRLTVSLWRSSPALQKCFRELVSMVELNAILFDADGVIQRVPADIKCRSFYLI